MENALRVRGNGNVARRAPGFIGDGERRYELVREISRGGMGTVHLGRLRGPLGFAKNVAIKTMHSRDVDDPQIARLFAAEARLTAGLCHANIVSTLDVLVEDGSVLIVMEYIDGSSLADLVSLAGDFGAALPVAVSCAIMHDVLLGLEHAHQAGVIHCDISPQNILVGTDGLARVVDFGIAKVASSARHSVPEWEDNTEIRGKVPYMAPEQLRGGKMDHRADLFAAGATLWELLTGSRLFRGANRKESAARVLGGHIDPPSRHLAEVPPALDAIVLQATQRDPRARFRSAREMADALAAAMPLASRASVIAALRRLDVGTPGSGIRALSPEQLAIRQHARATRNAPPPLPKPDGEDRRTTMSLVKRQAKAASLRVRLLTIGLLGVALGAGQVAFGIVPIGPYVARLMPAKPSGHQEMQPKPVAIAMPSLTAPMVGSLPDSAMSASAMPVTEASSKPRNDKPRGRNDKSRR